MKKISEHLGQIIVALACVAVLITTVTFFQAPISNFFAGVIGKETSLGNTLMQGISDTDLSSISINGGPRLEGDGQEFYTLAPTPLTFRSTADLADFKEVQINGQTIDPSNYTLEEGSTIVTLDIAYLQTLGVTDHEITVVSSSGSPSADFAVVAPESNDCGIYYNEPYVGKVDGMGEVTAIFHKDNTVEVFIDGNLYQTTEVEYGEQTVQLPMLGVTGSVNRIGTKIDLPELGTQLLLIHKQYDGNLNEHGLYYDVAYVHEDGSALVFSDNGVKLFSDGYWIDSVTYYVEYNDDAFNIPFANLAGVISSDGEEIEVSISGEDATFVLDDNYYYVGMQISIGDYLYKMRTNGMGGDKYWNVTAIDKWQSSYGEIKSEVEGFPVAGMQDAFANCTNLTVAPAIPDSVTNVTQAFDRCTSLLSARIGNGVKRLCMSPFANCTSLVSVTIPNSVKIIDGSAFRGCNSLINITFEGTVNEWNAIDRSGNWNEGVPAREVVCSNGVVSLS